MYGRNEAVAPPAPIGGERRGRSGGGPVASATKDAVEPDAVAAAQELTSKPVAELLATQDVTQWDEVGGVEGIVPGDLTGDEQVPMDTQDVIVGSLRGEGSRGGGRRLSEDSIDDENDDFADYLASVDENATMVSTRTF